MKSLTLVVAAIIATAFSVGWYALVQEHEFEKPTNRLPEQFLLRGENASRIEQETTDKPELGNASDGDIQIRSLPVFSRIRSLPVFTQTKRVRTKRTQAEIVSKASSADSVDNTNKVILANNTTSTEADKNEFAGLFAQAYRSISDPPKLVDPAPSDNEFPSDYGLDSEPLIPVEMRGERVAEASPESNDFPQFPDSADSSQESQPEESVGALETETDWLTADIEPSDEALWWKLLVSQPLNPNNKVQTADTNSLIYQALKNSPRIQAISKDPLIRELQVMEARADFDPVSFVRGLWDDRNDPVGNTLTTGGAPRLEDHIISSIGGIRKKLAAGGDIELGQTIGFQNSNSNFFVPQDQGTATLALNFTQPLMRGRGKFYNESQILIAQSSAGVTWEIFQAELQIELEAVAESYWQLYYDRSVYLQKKRNVARGQTILEMLEGRSELDSLPSQITRARSAVLSRKTELVVAYNAVRNAETEIRRLIADPNWMASQSIEILPSEPALQSDYNIPLKQVVQTAIDFRPEIKESLQRAKIAAIQYDVSTNELLPELSFLFGTYMAALDGDSGIERAFQSQYSGTTPGYSVGFEFEFPIYNRAARSRVAQQSVQRSKIRYEVSEVMQNIIAEAQFAHRRLKTAYETMNASKFAIEAAIADLDQNHHRWTSFALVEGDIVEGQTPTTILDQLLDSQDRLTIAEFVYSTAEKELKVAEVEIRRVMGTLLVHEKVDFLRTEENCAPSLIIGTTEVEGQFVDDAYEVQPLPGTEMLSPEQLEQLQQQPNSPPVPQAADPDPADSSNRLQDFQPYRFSYPPSNAPLR